MSHEKMWDELASAGESEWREERYRQAIPLLCHACDIALPELGSPVLSKTSEEPLSDVVERFSVLFPKPEGPLARLDRLARLEKPENPVAEIDTKRFSGLARTLAILGSCRDQVGETDAAERAFRLSEALVVCLIERRASEIVGEIDAIADLLRQCGRADLDQAVRQRMGDKVLELLG